MIFYPGVRAFSLRFGHKENGVRKDRSTSRDRGVQTPKGIIGHIKRMVAWRVRVDEPVKQDNPSHYEGTDGASTARLVFSVYIHSSYLFNAFILYHEFSVMLGIHTDIRLPWLKTLMYKSSQYFSL